MKVIHQKKKRKKKMKKKVGDNLVETQLEALQVIFVMFIFFLIIVNSMVVIMVIWTKHGMHILSC